jgi:hypothetical protein
MTTATKLGDHVFQKNRTFGPDVMNLGRKARTTFRCWKNMVDRMAHSSASGGYPMANQRKGSTVDVIPRQRQPWHGVAK